MRILHTADWHLGRQLDGHSLEADHAHVLDQILAATIDHAPDVLLLAGDVFDRAAPPESAVRQLNGFMQRLMRETTTAIVVIAGNHDSADRIGAMATLADGRRALVRGPLLADEPPLLLHDMHGPVAISALPFAYEHAARACFDDAAISSPEDVLRAQVIAARRHLEAGTRWIVVAHAFVAGAAPSESERPLSRVAGGIETVPAEVFAGAHYIALGHLHRPQAVGAAHVRYAGAPLAYGFDEEGAEKSMALVDLDAAGAVTTRLLAFSPLRHVRTLRGTLAEILAAAGESPSPDLVRIVLTDPARLVDPMKRVRTRYPNACGLVYERETAAPETKAARHSGHQLDDPATVVAAFLADVRGRPQSDAEAGIVADGLTRLATRTLASASPVPSAGGA